MRVSRESNRSALLDRRGSEVCDQHLKDTYVANNEDWTNLLFNVHHNRFETASQIAITFTSWESSMKWIQYKLFVPILYLYQVDSSLTSC
jgi:hypothetical protein